VLSITKKEGLNCEIDDVTHIMKSMVVAIVINLVLILEI
jgi:hypothetical protein